MKLQTKKARILKHLQSGKSITPKQAIELFFYYRLSDLIFKLKKDGFKFHTQILRNQDSHFAKYKMLNQASEELK